MSGFREYNDNFMKNFLDCPKCGTQDGTYLGRDGSLRCAPCRTRRSSNWSEFQPLELHERPTLQEPQRASEQDIDLPQQPATGNLLGECDRGSKGDYWTLPSLRLERFIGYPRYDEDGQIRWYRNKDGQSCPVQAPEGISSDGLA